MDVERVTPSEPPERGRPILVVAIGGNALAPSGDLRGGVAESLGQLDRSYRLVVTHGNGPQVGRLARQSEALGDAEPVPLDVLDAESAGLIGYLLAGALGPYVDDRVAVLLTRVVVDPRDPAFGAPSKPIGPSSGPRRLVPSPEPVRVVELESLRALAAIGVVLICGGGGGVPVAQVDGQLRGVEAVVDKDLTSALIAEELGADELLVLMDAPAVVEGWGTDTARPIGTATPEQLRRGSWEAGSMAPKIAAACRFVEHTGRVARIGALDAAADVLAGRAGTCIQPDRG